MPVALSASRVAAASAVIWSAWDWVAKFGIFAAAVQRIGGRGGADRALLAVDESDANAECAEVDSGDDGHGNFSSAVNASEPFRVHHSAACTSRAGCS